MDSIVTGWLSSGIMSHDMFPHFTLAGMKHSRSQLL